MTTHESVTADIKQLLDAFDHFVNLIELENWLKNVTVEDIKSSFKLSGFIEESIIRLQAKQCVDLFMDILISWWKAKDRTKVYKVDYFSLASDYLLSKFFTCKFISVNTLDIAVRMYTTLYPKERFESFIRTSILNSASIEAMIDYAIVNKDNIDLKELECRFLLRHWSTETECGRKQDVIAVITNMLSNYKIETSLSSLIIILALKNVSSQEMAIKNLILKELQLRMVDRSILSKHLWLSLFTHVDKKHLGAVCKQFREFLKELYDFIIYISCMMNPDVQNDQTRWISDSNISICPELTYNDLVSLIKFFCNYNEELKSYTVLRISEAKVSTNSQIWVQLEKDAV